MMGSSDEVSLVVFALLAVFVIWKLRSVLGSRPGAEPPREPLVGSGRDAPTPARGPGEMGKVLRLPGVAPEGPPRALERWKGYAEPGTALWTGLDAIAAGDPNFDPAIFSSGAAKAYELVIVAFAAGDRETLKNLLSPDVYQSFEQEMVASQTRGETRQVTIVSADAEGFEDARVTNGSAQITVRFASKLISTTRDKDGAVVQGDAERVEGHLDDWTFARALQSQDPNWKLIATHSAD
jgi:predicted lipid-binding transport protein (Tim44 family)